MNTALLACFMLVVSSWLNEPRFTQPISNAAAHHIQPLGIPYNGPDVIGNILCLCPNHHAELDYGVRALTVAGLSHLDGHELDPRFVEYHNRKIHGGRNEAALVSAGAP